MDDKEIVQLFLQRDESGLEELDRKYGRFCASIAENILKSRTDAEECVNDAYLKVWNSIPPAVPRSLSAFIAKITRNTALDVYALYHTEKRGSGGSAVSFDELEDLVSGESSIEQETENRELLEAINKFLSTLPSAKRRMFVNRYWYCYTVEELARIYEMQEHNVVVALSRTRKKLKEYLKKRGFEI